MTQNIKAMRQKSHISQNKLAKILGVGQSTVAMWENGTNNPRANKIKPLAAALNCTVDDLLREDYSKSTVPKNGL